MESARVVVHYWGDYGLLILSIIIFLATMFMAVTAIASLQEALTVTMECREFNFYQQERADLVPIEYNIKKWNYTGSEINVSSNTIRENY